ncbi:putative pentatricopeptide repeat-containing protein At1g77010, mitochondrial [Coffea eugenioides]|uniref:putative pentatricopeptide repeat-containing protein At1g77010, mitochondrial n=1 Tax=Coffea eugenioides TaxID=49369 RepID=UPI000F60E262|nr:putative pentatricopeptide repeat-containing protein At1g77010, mitochondrial [Coffea eugenioides]XP_027148182.1 putative pentatricopeptide repeat-containing protein At1g77010, mitochondrial [Coffea eugenioides]XP_027148183.1 putative pentatricopeptide repeat-containing protein At1g77010, mitochondrial [Coffea eugenioides]XP_027148184.1 putative pentatricopeptide repeat-containing protein At1g77010, mitochondrial [Coffea eugenioides]
MDLDLQCCARILSSFKAHHHILQGRQLHLLFLKRGLLNAAVNMTNRLLQMYTRCGQISDARKLFDEMGERNSFSWNTLLEGYVKHGRVKDSLDLFNLMPDKNDFSWNLMIPGLVKARELDVACGLLNVMPRKNGIVLNSLMHGYVRNGCPYSALMLFRDCLKLELGEGVCRDNFVLATAISACADLGSLDYGKQIHTHIIVSFVERDSVLGSSLVNMYAKCGQLDTASQLLHKMQHVDDFSLSALISGYANCGRIDDARKIFELKTDPCIVLWNSLIAGYITNDEETEAISLFLEMRKEGVSGDFSTFTSILSACSSTGIVKYCQQLHSDVCKLGFIDDLIVASALVDTYSKCQSPHDACALYDELKVHDTVLLNSMITIYSNCGRIEDAKRIFLTMPDKSLISWNSIIVGLSQNGCPIEALNLFSKMNRINLSMDKFSLASVISACASISSVEFGEQVFARATIVGLDLNQTVSSSLIDFYCKCGFVESGQKIFDQTKKDDVVLWNSLLMGYATNGYAIQTLNVFYQMTSADMVPTYITFIGVLSACNHCGLAEEAQKWFDAMKDTYHIDPGIEHYSCMIDLFARSGCLEEAVSIIEEMPFKADASMWSSILRGCLAHEDRSLGKKVVDLVMVLDPENSVGFVQLSNIFATSYDWERSALVRKLMKDNKIQKNPGLSWGGT